MPFLPFIFSFGCAISFYCGLSTRRASLRRFVGKAGFRHSPFASPSFPISLPDRDSNRCYVVHAVCRLFVRYPHIATHMPGRTAFRLLPLPSSEVGRYVSTPGSPSPPHTGTNRGLVPVADWSFRFSEPATIVSPRLFRDCFLSKSSSLFRCKVSVQTGPVP